MQKIFADTRLNDQLTREHYKLSEDIMMENAAAALERECNVLLSQTSPFAIDRPAVLILCGKGNNGGDGYALARRIQDEKYSVTVCQLDTPATESCRIQAERAEAAGVNFISGYDLDDFIERKGADLKLVCDCIYGAGFHGELPPMEEAAVTRINQLDSDVKRLSCDIPTPGFVADCTVIMGALKLPLFSDNMKDLCGRTVIADLGISRKNFEFESHIQPEAFLLEETDLTFPFRKKQNVNKGNFGHGVFISGEKEGASQIGATAALNYGAGLVTLVSKEKIPGLSAELMQSSSFPENTTAVCMGPGLGRNLPDSLLSEYFNFILDNSIAAVLDADVFYYPAIKVFLKDASDRKLQIVLTPHPKEFAVLLKNCGLGEYTVPQVVENRIQLIKDFTRTFPGLTLLVKGANTVIGQNNSSGTKLYVNNFGTSALSKAGSGDVLSGLITALLAQKWPSIKAACNGSLIHALGAKKIEPDFSLTPLKLIKSVQDVVSSVQA